MSGVLSDGPGNYGDDEMCRFVIVPAQVDIDVGLHLWIVELQLELQWDWLWVFDGEAESVRRHHRLLFLCRSEAVIAVEAGAAAWEIQWLQSATAATCQSVRSDASAIHLRCKHYQCWIYRCIQFDELKTPPQLAPHDRATDGYPTTASVTGSNSPAEQHANHRTNKPLDVCSANAFIVLCRGRRLV